MGVYYKSEVEGPSKGTTQTHLATSAPNWAFFPVISHQSHLNLPQWKYKNNKGHIEKESSTKLLASKAFIVISNKHFQMVQLIKVL
jgi:hypothetical protein